MAIYCRCSDGWWYKNPIWRGPQAEIGHAWYVLFNRSPETCGQTRYALDDDPPPRMIVTPGVVPPDLAWFQLRSPRIARQEIFSGAGAIVKRPPPPDAHLGRCRKPKPSRDCVYYSAPEK